MSLETVQRRWCADAKQKTQRILMQEAEYGKTA